MLYSKKTQHSESVSHLHNKTLNIHEMDYTYVDYVRCITNFTREWKYIYAGAEANGPKYKQLLEITCDYHANLSYKSIFKKYRIERKEYTERHKNNNFERCRLRFCRRFDAFEVVDVGGGGWGVFGGAENKAKYSRSLLRCKNVVFFSINIGILSKWGFTCLEGGGSASGAGPVGERPWPAATRAAAPLRHPKTTRVIVIFST